MQSKEELQGSKEENLLDAKAARTPSSPTKVLGSALPWHGRSASPGLLFTPNWEEAYQEKKEGRFYAHRPQVGVRKWTVSPMNHDFSSMSSDGAARYSENATNTSAMVPASSSTNQSVLSAANSTSSSSSMGVSDVSDTDLRNLTNVLGTSCNSYQLPPISIGRLWEEAIVTQNVQSVQQLLNWGFDASGDGALMIRSPLMLAVLTGSIALVKMLLTTGADINCHDMEGLTPLHLAAASGDRNIAKLLLVAGADLYARTKKGLFPLQLATDDPTYQMLSQRMRSDMGKPCTPSRRGLPCESSSGNLMQVDLQALRGSSVASQIDSRGKEATDFLINDSQSSSSIPVKGPKQRATIFRCGSDSYLLESKITSPSRINTAALSTQNTSGSIPARDGEREDPSYCEDRISSLYSKGTFDEGKQPTGSHNVWLQNLFQDITKSQEATKAAKLRNQELNSFGGEGQVDRKDKRLNVPEDVVGGLSKTFTSVSTSSELENEEGLRRSRSTHSNEYVQVKRRGFGDMVDQKDKEISSTLSRHSQLKLDEKSPNNPASDVSQRNDEGQDSAPARSDSEISLCSVNPFNQASGSMINTSQGTPSNVPADMLCCVKTEGSMMQKERTIMQGTSLSEMKEARKDCGNCPCTTMQSNVHSVYEPVRTDVKKLDEDAANSEDTSEILPAHDHASCKQNQERKQVKFVPPLEADLALVRKDWHKAAGAGCVGCGAEGCGGECIPKSGYGKPTQEKPSNASSSSKPRKAFRKAQMRKTKNFEWKRGELLGEGAYGKVFCGLNQSTGELMAVKQLKFHNLTDNEDKAFYLTCLEREISLYKEMRHNHIVGYIDMDKDEKSGYLYIFLEYVSGGSIQSMLERFGPFTEPLVRVYTRQLLLGLEYLHKNRIVHRDIKGGNVLVNSDGVVKLADFGASKAFHEATITDACKSIRGSVFWMAPEVIKGDNYGRHADMWSVGCTVIEMLTAMHPWPGIDNTWAAIFQIAKASSGPPVPETVSDCAKDFLAKCFHLDPKMRSSAPQLLEHPFVAKAEEMEQGVVVQDG